MPNDPFDRIEDQRNDIAGEWRAKFQKGAKGKPIKNLHNVLIVLAEDPYLSHCFGFDEMLQAQMLMQAMPGMPEGSGRLMDNDYLHVQRYIQRFEFPMIGLELVRNAVDFQCKENAYHPVLTYLEGLTWDGRARFHRFWRDYFGAIEQPEDYLNQIAICFLVAMVARIYEPGCKADYMVVLEGKQGIGKSQACRILGGEWFGDSMPTLDGRNEKDVSAYLTGKWLVEDSELGSHNRGEINRLKAFLSRQEEDYRRPYARLPAFEPRSCVLIGTTNEDQYLRDTTGGRRFWPIKCAALDLAALQRDRDQLFAEAVFRYKEKTQWWPAFNDIILAEQEARYEEDFWEDIIREKSDGLTIATRTDLCDWLGLTNVHLAGPTNKRITTIMKRLGWVQKRSKTSRYWQRAAETAPDQLNLADLDGL